MRTIQASLLTAFPVVFLSESRETWQLAEMWQKDQADFLSDF